MRSCTDEDILGLNSPTTSTQFDIFNHEGNRVQVWLIRQKFSPEDIALGYSFLSKSEQSAAQSIVYQWRRGQWVMSRFILRNLCSKHLGIPFSEVEFVRDQYGKISLGRPCLPQKLEFSLSHSGDLLCVAFAKGRKVGVDVEIHLPDFQYEGILADHFTSEEIRRLLQIPEPLRTRRKPPAESRQVLEDIGLLVELFEHVMVLVDRRVDTSNALLLQSQIQKGHAALQLALQSQDWRGSAKVLLNQIETPVLELSTELSSLQKSVFEVQADRHIEQRKQGQRS